MPKKNSGSIDFPPADKAKSAVEEQAEAIAVQGESRITAEEARIFAEGQVSGKTVSREDFSKQMISTGSLSATHAQAEVIAGQTEVRISPDEAATFIAGEKARKDANRTGSKPETHASGVSPRDLGAEEAAQEEYYTQHEAGTLPSQPDGSPISFIDFMDTGLGSNTLLPPDATHGEVKARIQSLRKKLSGIATPEGDSKMNPKELYEMRTRGIATKHGLENSYEKVRTVREAYLKARALAHQQGFAQDDIGDLKQAYDRSLFEWRTSLTEKAQGLSGMDRAELLVTAKRDTILGPANVEMEARERALTEKGKTAFGRAQVWASRSPLMLLKGLNYVPNVVGGVLAHTFHSGASEKSGSRRLSERDYARIYARNVRILAGAGLATLVAVSATPVSVGGGLLAFTVFSARGALGTLAGMGGAKAAGAGFNFFHRNKRSELKERIAKAPATLEEYQEQQLAYQQGNTRKRSQQKMGWQMVAAMLTGAGVGAASSPLVHSALEQIGALPSVREAAQSVAEVNASSPEAGPEAVRLADSIKETAEHVQAQAEVPTADHALVTSAAIARSGEGFGELLQEMKSSIHEKLPGGAEASAALAYVLNSNPNELAHELLAAKDGSSLTMHMGDQLVLDGNQNIWFHPKGGEPQLVLENNISAPEGFVRHSLSGPMQVDGGERLITSHEKLPSLSEQGLPQRNATAELNEREITAQLNRSSESMYPVPAVQLHTEDTAVETGVSHSANEHVIESGSREGISQRDFAPNSVPETLPQPVVAPVAGQPEVVHAAPVPEEAVAAPVEAGQPFYNNHDVEVSPLETRVYSAADDMAPGGEQLIVFGGGDARDESFLSRVQEVARANPGRKVYFDAGYQVDFNGVPQKWINAAVYDPQGGMRIGITPEGPEMIGVINPDSFTRKLQ